MIRIVWDWNGTLFNDVDLCLRCMNSLLLKYENKSLNGLKHYKEIFGFPIQDYYKKAGFDFEKNSYEVLAHEYMDAYMKDSIHCPLQYDALEACEFVKSHGMKQVILSASQKDNLLEQLKKYSISSYMDQVYGITDIYAKSKQALALRLKEDFPEDTFYFIGDSIHDVEVAHSIGCECICVTCGHQSRKQLQTKNCIIKDSLLESVEYIYARNKNL